MESLIHTHHNEVPGLATDSVEQSAVREEFEAAGCFRKL